MSESTRIPVYQQHAANGAVRDQAAGLEFAPAGPGRVAVRAAELGGLRPRAGDALTTAAGERLRVREVAGPADGAYTLTCEPEGGAA